MLANGRGGYCMENCIFFNHVLRALGFQVYMAGARIRLRVDGVPTGDYIGWYTLVVLELLSLCLSSYLRVLKRIPS